jgi:transposase
MKNSENVCGIDVYKKIMVCATISKNLIEVRNFKRNSGGILELREYLKDKEIKRVTIESTGIYWKPVYNGLKGDFEVLVTNPYSIKYIGRKTDEIDAVWLAKLLKTNLISPSYIPDSAIEELRELTRFRLKLLGNLREYKNRTQSILAEACIDLGKVLRDIFGKDGLIILKGIANGKDIDEIIEESNSKFLKKRKKQIKEVIQNKLSIPKMFILQKCVEQIQTIKHQILEINEIALVIINAMSGKSIKNS